MQQKIMNSKILRLYVIFTYLLFWALLGLTGFLISIDVPIIIQNIMKNGCAWSPTFVVLIMFRKLYPNTKLRDFFSEISSKKVKSQHFILLLLIQLTILVVAVIAYLNFSDISFDTISLISFSGLIPAFIMSLTSGAIGEELGWRAYVLNTLQKKYAPVKAALIVGLAWAFWHLPLWILSGYAGLDLLYYCIVFIIGILSLSVVITIYYNKDQNILIAVWIHFLFNFSLQLVIIDLLELLTFLSAGYLLFALVLITINKHEFLKKHI